MDAGGPHRPLRIDVGKDRQRPDPDLRPPAPRLSMKIQQTISHRIHPESKKRGALIYAGGTEILLFPGDLDDRTIQRELTLRRTADFTVPEGGDHEKVEVHQKPRRFGLDMSSLPPPELDVDDAYGNAPTIPLEAFKKRGQPDPLAFAAMPTISGAPIPRGVQDSARVGLRPEPETAPGDEPSGGAEEGGPAADPAEGPRRSWGPSPARAAQRRLQPRPAEPRRNGTEAGPRRNAWGERTPHDGPKTPPPKRHSWGDEDPTDGHEPVNNRARPASPSPPADPTPRVPQLYAGRELSMAALAQRVKDPALQILREPDGEFATQIRVFGTRLQDLARTYGYRAAC
jgi:hypothetical protein